jgi:two-component system, OmpR family, sensor kinase
MAVTSERVQDTLERLFEIPVTDLHTALSDACDVMARAFGADKVDAFMYEPTRDSLIALGSSHQPLSARQKRHGLDVMPLSNGGRVVHVYTTAETFLSGRLDQDPEELRGVKEVLEVRSMLGVPLHVGGTLRGALVLASQKPDFFDSEDHRFADSVVRWVGVIAHRAELSNELGRTAVEQGRRAVAEELITVLAHDLRNYIVPIELRLAVVARRLEGHEAERDAHDVRTALEGVRRLGAMISDILDLARIDQGVLAVQQDPIDLTALLNDIARALSSPSITVKVHASEPVVLVGDRVRIRQCVDNLVANAVRHSPAGGAVEITLSNETRNDGTWARVEIVDQGAGIPPELLPRIFERFVRGPGKSGGLGLGLHLAKQIALLHGGELTVSTRAGQGARFILTLPGVIAPTH